MKAILLKVVTNPGVRKAAIGLVLAILAALGLNLSGCGPSLAQLAEREGCYSKAEAVAQARVNAECGDAGFSQCAAAEAILEDLQKRQESCP